MIENLIVYIQSIISEHGAWGVFFATIIEELVAPIPSPLIPLAAGFFLLPDGMSLAEITLRGVITIAIPVSVGISVGSAFVYALGFFGGKPVIEKSKKLTGINWKDIQTAEEKITRGSKDELSLFALRLLPIVPGVAVSGFCGVVRYPFNKFIIITGIGAFFRAFVLGMIGWQVGELYANYADMISRFEKYIFLGLIASLVLFIGGYYAKKKMGCSQNNQTNI
jgi:membrane protein DedA with SNARE-associated domain